MMLVESSIRWNVESSIKWSAGQSLDRDVAETLRMMSIKKAHLTAATDGEAEVIRGSRRDWCLTKGPRQEAIEVSRRNPGSKRSKRRQERVKIASHRTRTELRPRMTDVRGPLEE